jgi:trimeric autotransporter adhesin
MAVTQAFNLANLALSAGGGSNVNGVYYNPNDIAVKLMNEDKTVRKVGVLAQEIQRVMPELVRQAPFDIADDGSSKSGENYLTVQYDRLVPLLVQAIKEQQKQILQLEADHAALLAKLNIS